MFTKERVIKVKLSINSFLGLEWLKNSRNIIPKKMDTTKLENII
jgi:hypothetical protein